MEKKRFPTRRRHGATLIEFALVLPILVILTLGIIEFGWYTKNQLGVANAVREGARVASIGQTQNQITTRIINSAAPVTVTTDNISLQYSTNNGASYTNFPADDTLKSPAQNGVPNGSLVRVTVNVPHRRVVNLPVTPTRIRVQVSMLRERT
jgi:Flp pilus assembly protein TadG